MQSTKVIDVTRSFVPVDPNSYPENLHGTSVEDDPERRVPVIPYMGHNFLPTAYGYKSFFGTNAKLAFTALMGKPDHVFVFQTLTYKNIVVALCDTGIWTKPADVTGDWTQTVAMAEPAPEIHYEWTYFTIKNKLYMFRANGAAYYTLETDADEETDAVSAAVVPTFITISAQLGMFRLGNRIGFWDAENAIAYSSADDHSNFTPAVLTGANVTTFNSVLGRISAIKPHGRHVIVYASKSIVALTIQASETFLIRAEPILSGVGVPYPKQVVEGVPDIVHYAYTTGGIYRIEGGKPEIIVPEVYDYFKPYTQQPVYLKLLQGRYLAFEILDPNAVSGSPIFRNDHFPGGSVTFPGYTSIDDGMENYPNPDNLCDIIDLINDGMTQDQQDMQNSFTPGKKPGTYAKPIWTAYLSRNGVIDPSSVEFGAIPCGSSHTNGTPWNMAPSQGVKLTDLTINSTGKTATTGPQAYKDGNWTIERFIQTQTAIWEMEEKGIEGFLEVVKSRSFSEASTAGPTNSCVVGSSLSDCFIGDFVSKFSKPQFGFNKCSFWLTRYAIGAEKIVARSNTSTGCTNLTKAMTKIGYQFNWDGTPNSVIYGSISAAIAGYVSQSGGVEGYSLSPGTQYPFSGSVRARSATTGIPNGGVDNYVSAVKFTNTTDGTSFMHNFLYIYEVWGYETNVSVYTGMNGTTPQQAYQNGYWDAATSRSLRNMKTEDLVGVLGVETAYCVLTGWEYTDINGVKRIVAADPDTCLGVDKVDNTSPQYQVPHEDPRPDIIDDDGSVCGELPDMPDEDEWDVDWPDQTVTYPPFEFLLQDGSIAPKYPTIYGAFVYDTHLKKWGKYKDEYKCLLDYSPVNSESSSPVSFTNFGILAGVFKDDRFIYVFDDNPDDSQITWGKIGYYRAGMTDLQEVRFDFKTVCSGNISVDVSLDGQSVIEALRTEHAYDGRKTTIYPPYSGAWFNLTLQGRFDVNYCEVIGLKKGRR